MMIPTKREGTEKKTKIAHGSALPCYGFRTGRFLVIAISLLRSFVRAGERQGAAELISRTIVKVN